MPVGTITEEMLGDLFSAWDEGLSALEVARSLSIKYDVAVTRNMVIGKVYRRREADRRAARGATVRSRPAAAAPPKSKAKKVSVAAPGKTVKTPPPAPKPAPKPRTKLPAEARFTKERPRGNLSQAAHAVDRLTGCKFPVGEISAPDFHFCNAEPLPHRPYCAHHCALAYNGIPSKKANPRPFT